jgi:hypothetical protein
MRKLGGLSSEEEDFVRVEVSDLGIRKDNLSKR